MKTIVAIYARLSREDEGKIDGSTESRSIENQIEILTNYAKNNGFDIFKVYYDDGYSGGNQNRPSFQELLNDMKNHKFNTILIKDLSRLGRSLHQVGKLVEETFPMYNIRCISISDKYDSLTYKDNESIVLRNFINAYYLKDFKRKIHKSLDYRAHTKHMTSLDKYGYIGKKTGEVEIDPYASKVVKEIFTLICGGTKISEIVKMLNDRGELIRGEYKKKIRKLAANYTMTKHFKWTPAMIASIIRDYEYCGHSINLKYSKKDSVLIKNTHPAIITEEEFKLANELTTRKFTKIDQRPENIASLMKVVDNDKLVYVKCSYQDRPIPKYTAYHIKLNLDVAKTNDIIYNDVVSFIKESQTHKDVVIKNLRKRYSQGYFNLNNMQQKLKELNNKYAKLFEQHFIGKLSSQKFEKESSKLKEEIMNLENKITSSSLEESKVDLLEKRFYYFIDSIGLSKPKVELIKMAVKRILIYKDKDGSFEFKIEYKFE